MNEKQIRFLIHCIAKSFGGTPEQTEEAEHEMNTIFNELGIDLQ